LKRILPLLLAALAALSACGPALDDSATANTVAANITPADVVPALAIVPEGGAGLAEIAGGPVTINAQEGLVFPILEVRDPWYGVVDTCGREAWVDQSSVTTVSRSTPGVPGPGFDLSSAVIVVDAGHGGRDLGAKGASGVWESHVNLEIATLLRERLDNPHSVDWETGRVRPGDDYPAVGAVWMTRAPDGPLNGDVELALSYRVGMGNQVGADAIVSVHNNSAPGVVSSSPGTDVFYAVGAPGSDRLASLIHEEMMRGLGELGSEFGAARVTGARTRVEPDGTDFYGLLRRGEMPTVIVEGLYISEPAEERILSSRVGQQAYADAVYRGLIRFLTSEETGTAIHPPEVFDGDVGTVTYQACVVPTQP
jgi:N-acetylmuramoyl-L-alanine amidase